MKFNDYSDFARTTASYPQDKSLEYLVLGLAGEAGECANKLKKVIRDDSSVLTEDKRKDLISEAGDCLWYLDRLAEALGTTLEGLAEANIEKLRGRTIRGTIKGSGDNR